MRSRYRVAEGGSPHFVSSTVVEWMPLFTSAPYCSVITDSLSYCREHKGLLLHAYVIMDNHIHLLVTAPDVTSLMRDFKSYTGKRIVELMAADHRNWVLRELEFYKKRFKTGSLHQIWQEGFHPEAVTTEEMLRQKMEYIHYNPVRRGVVAAAEHWLYSSASNYCSGTGIIDIDPVG